MPAIKSKDRVQVDINKNFVIRYSEDDKRVSKLIGAGQYDKLVGEELKIKHFKRVLEGRSQVYTFKLRRGLKIEFHSK